MGDGFFTGYRKNIIEPDEVLVSILFPYTTKDQHFLAYKQAKRRDDDIAIVNLALNVEFEPGTSIVKYLNMSFGGKSIKESFIIHEIRSSNFFFPNLRNGSNCCNDTKNVCTCHWRILG